MNVFSCQYEYPYGRRECDKQGVCGKNWEIAALQDLLIYAVEGLGQYAYKTRRFGVQG